MSELDPTFSLPVKFTFIVNTITMTMVITAIIRDSTHVIPKVFLQAAFLQTLSSLDFAAAALLRSR